MKTQFISSDGISYIRTLNPVDCPFHEKIDNKIIGLFIDPDLLEPLATGRNGGWFGVANGRQYSLEGNVYADPSECPQSSYPVASEYGGGYISANLSSIKQFINQAALKLYLRTMRLNRIRVLKLKKLRDQYVHTHYPDVGILLSGCGFPPMMGEYTTTIKNWGELYDTMLYGDSDTLYTIYVISDGQSWVGVTKP